LPLALSYRKTIKKEGLRDNEWQRQRQTCSWIA